MTNLLYPIFLPVVLWGTLFPLWILFTATPPSNLFGAFAVGIIIILWGAVLQLLLGVPSQFLLRRWRSLRAHVALGATLGCAIAARTISIEEGESLFKDAALTVLCVLPPFIVGYARLFYLRARELALPERELANK